MLQMLDLSSLFIASAHAQGTAAGMPPEPSPMASMLPFLLVLVVFWFFVLRPQSKRYKEHQAMVKALKKGDRIVTGGGIIGKVVKAVEGADTVEVEIAPTVTVEITRATITALAPAAEKKAPAASKPAAPRKKKAADEAQSSANDN